VRVLLVGYWVLEKWSYKYKTNLFGGIIVILVSGHFWIYPQKISQGWDSTTLHWQYFNVSNKMHDYIIDSGINPSEIGTFFPEYKSRKRTHLEQKDWQVSKFDSTQDYMLYSNAFNVEDSILDVLAKDKGNWQKQKSFTSLGVEMTLYQRVK